MADDTLPPPDGYHLTRTYGAHEWVTPDEYATVYRDNAREVRPVMYADTVRRLLAERDERIRVLTEALQECIDTLENLQGGCTDSNDGTVEALTVYCPEVIDAARAALEARNG